MLKLRIDSGPGSNKVRHDMPIHERQEARKIDSEDGPRVSKGQTGKRGRKEDRKQGVLDARCAHCQWPVLNG